MNPTNVLLSYPDGIAIFDLRLNVVFSNPLFNEVFGTPKNKKTAEAIFAKTPALLTHLRNFLKDGVSYLDHGVPIETAAGKTEPHEILIRAIDFGEKKTGVCMIVRPNLGRKEIDEELEKGEKISILSIMSVGLAHEIKNPLGGIRGLAQIMGRENLDVRETCDLIIKETDRISGLVTDLLDLEKARDISPENLNIHKTIDETLALHDTIFRENKIVLTRDYDPSLPDISADENRLKQVFVNLVKNAVETMGGGGSLRVKTRIFLDQAPIAKKGAKGFIAVDFMDTGKGINAHVAKNMFTPFNTDKKGGTGLGLAISLNIVKAHGGTMTIENNKDGKGVTARVILPR